MPLPQSGAISFSNINEQLGVAATTTRSLNDAAVRALFRNGVNSSANTLISLSEGYTFNYTFTVATHSNINIRATLVAAGWNQSAWCYVTIPSGAILRSTTNAGPGLAINGSFPNNIYIKNSGTIVGKGGNGAYFNAYNSGVVASVAGGAGISVTSVYAANVLKLENAGIIGGGGGGGQGTGTVTVPFAGGSLGGNGGAGYGADGWNWFSGTKYWQYAGGAATNQTSSATAVTPSGGNIWTTLPMYTTQNTAGARPTTGAGGALGASGGGVSGAYWSYEASGKSFVWVDRNPGVCGAASAGGNATIGQSNITWVANGTRYGTLG